MKELQNNDTLPLTKDELLYVLDSIEDFEEGRYITISAEESDEEFLRLLKEEAE